jgi:hypothetical protein
MSIIRINLSFLINAGLDLVDRVLATSCQFLIVEDFMKLLLGL